MDLGPTAVFIWASYAAAVVVPAALAAWLMFDGQRQRRMIDELESRGVRRRSERGRPSDRDTG